MCVRSGAHPGGKPEPDNLPPAATKKSWGPVLILTKVNRPLPHTQNEEERHAIHHGRKGKLRQHRSLLRRPRKRSASGPDSRMAAERPFLGAAGAAAGGRRVSRHH